MELDDTVVETGNRKSNLDPIARMAAEQEEFLQDLEQDRELRANINMYQDPARAKPTTSKMDVDHGNSTGLPRPRNESGEDHEDDEDYPEVPIEELLEGLNIQDDPEGALDPNSTT